MDRRTLLGRKENKYSEWEEDIESLFWFRETHISTHTFLVISFAFIQMLPHIPDQWMNHCLPMTRYTSKYLGAFSQFLIVLIWYWPVKTLECHINWALANGEDCRSPLGQLQRRKNRTRFFASWWCLRAWKVSLGLFFCWEIPGKRENWWKLLWRLHNWRGKFLSP